MKHALVTYSSSEEDDEDTIQQPIPVKKRKLPSLPASLTPPVPIDDPALHQGRTRTTPHVEGQFAAHVYVALLVGKESALGRLVGEVMGFAGGTVPGLCEIGNGNDGEECGEGNKFELHLSLSRPTYLRARQREEFKRAVKAVARRFHPFTASFAAFAELTNDEQTRTFLTMEVGAGHIELTSLTEALTPALHAIRQKEFYADPRFHASIAWVLRGNNFLLQCAPSSADTSIHTPSTAGFPPLLLQTLNAKYSPRLARAGVFEVGEVHVKIGKEVVGWRLEGPQRSGFEISQGTGTDDTEPVDRLTA